MILRGVDIDRFNGPIERLVFASSRYTLPGTQGGVAASTRTASGIASPRRMGRGSWSPRAGSARGTQLGLDARDADELDELPEFMRRALEALRQPLEGGNMPWWVRDQKCPLSGAESARLRQLVELEQEVAEFGEALRA